MQIFTLVYLIRRHLSRIYHSDADFLDYVEKMDGSFFWDMVAREVERQRTSFEWLYRKTLVSKGTFSSWKTRNLLPRADAAYRIARALGVSVEYLLTGRDEARSPSNPALQELIESVTRALIVFDPFDRENLAALVSTMTRRYRAPEAL
jgi:transcriptional regulator with XRE-family HTH domain